MLLYREFSLHIYYLKMAEEAKKISFGFSKLKKTTNLVKKVETSKPEVEYVDSFDGVKGKFSYKGNIRSDEPVKKELVIPLIGTKTALEVIIARLEEKNSINEKNDSDNVDKLEVGTRSNGKDVEPASKDETQRDADKESNAKELSIDDLAAKEILNDLQSDTSTDKNSKSLVIKQGNKISKITEETQIDYENIPVNDFGLAMLRGMGWTPETGIGKEQRVVKVVAPKLRPKGLGLGADKVLSKQQNQDLDLTITIKSYVKFLSGLHKGNYGQVEAMDDDTGRVTVKLALGGIVSVSEVLLIPVSKKEYEKNGMVLNPMKYENFKEQNLPSDVKEKQNVESSSSRRKSKYDEGNRHRKEEYGDRERKDRHSSSPESLGRRSEHKKKKKGTRDESKERRHKKSKKKKSKKKYSDYESLSSDDREKCDSSRSHSHSSKSRTSSYR